MEMETSKKYAGIILVVDDEEEALRAISTLLERKGGYRALAASSGKEAIEILASNEVDLVITDLRMPGMDGIELLNHIHLNYPDVFVMISTAFGSLDSAVDAMRKGATDYLQKPNNPKEVLDKVAEMLERRKKLMVERKSATAVREMAESQASELRRAGEIQQRWIPHGYEGAGIRVVTTFQGATDLSGDFIDLVKLPGGKLGIAVGDIVGHGLPASLQMGIVQRLIKKELLESKGAAEIFTSLNDFLYDEFHMDSAFTSFLAIYNPDAYTMKYSIGGHPPPIILRGDGEIELLNTSCPGLLMMPGYKFLEHSMVFSAGDRFCVYTDGVVELRNRDGDMFGEDRLEEVLLINREIALDAAVDNIGHALNEFRDDAPIVDDISIILADIV